MIVSWSKCSNKGYRSMPRRYTARSPRQSGLAKGDDPFGRGRRAAPPADRLRAVGAPLIYTGRDAAPWVDDVPRMSSTPAKGGGRERSASTVSARRGKPGT